MCTSMEAISEHKVHTGLRTWLGGARDARLTPLLSRACALVVGPRRAVLGCVCAGVGPARLTRPPCWLGFVRQSRLPDTCWM